MPSMTPRALFKRTLRQKTKQLLIGYFKERGVKLETRAVNGLMAQFESLVGRQFLPIGTSRMNQIIDVIEKGGFIPKQEPAPQPSKKQQRRKAWAGFYYTREWRELRYQVLKESSGCCGLCGALPRKGHPLHVDHILPRSKFPKLSLEKTNLQVLCEDCNLGKSNKDETDWRYRILAD